MSGKPLDQVMLSGRVSVAAYRKMEQHQAKADLAAFIEERLCERYIDPLESVPSRRKNGFSIMAVGCLLIETLESFYQGWDDTSGKMERSSIAAFCKPVNARNRVSMGEVAFCYFFHREPEFEPYRSYAAEFFHHIRCGILHQGESTGGWRILRRGPLFDSASKTVNATALLRTLRLCLGRYRKELEKADWTDDLWQKFRRKMQAVIDHCQ